MARHPDIAMPPPPGQISIDIVGADVLNTE
jgi:hypothetical protein